MASERLIPFNVPYTTGGELGAIQEAISHGHLSGNGTFSRRCCEWLEAATGSSRVLLTHSCTGALEMATLLADIGPGDEVIMPSFTFVSTANAVVLRGATPVFVDVVPETLTLDAERAAEAVTERTAAIMPVHYAGVGCDMDALMAVADAAGAIVIEDAAHGILAAYRGRALGGIGQLGAFSFHETKNVACGEGGALLVNDEALVERAEIIHEKGTNRRNFLRGRVDKYTWEDVGSSFPLSDLNAAFLSVQLEHAEEITRRRLGLWARYHELLEPLESRGLLRRPIVPDECTHNAHMYYVLVDAAFDRGALLDDLAARGVNAVFHYVPLHSSSVGRRFGRTAGELRVTDDASARLVRLPLWAGLREEDVDRVIEAVHEVVL